MEHMNSRKCITTLVYEHDNIKKMLEVIENASLLVLRSEDVNVEDFKRIVGFIRSYADNIHHGKEEEFLFKEIMDNLGDLGKNLVRHGMMVEHELARLYVSDLDAALNAYQESPTEKNRLSILVSAGSYANLLHRHIEKENDVVFPFSERSLDNEVLQKLDELTVDFDHQDQNTTVRTEQILILEELRMKYSDC